MLALLTVTASVLASMPAPPTVSAPATAVVSEPSKRDPIFGVKLDVGVPDGLGLSLAVRPWKFLRFEVGMLENGVAPGIRAGIAFLPYRSWVTPVLVLDGGYYFAGNANSLVRTLSGDAAFGNGFLNSVQYDFGNAHVGLEFGSSRRFVFFVHGGLTHIDAHDNSFEAGLQQSGGSTWSSGSAVIHLNTLSAKLGFLLYIG